MVDKLSWSELNQITEKVIGCAFTVANTLGTGFLEKVYENALAHEVQKVGLKVQQQHDIDVHYDGLIVGEFVADLLVEDVVLIELKGIRAFEEFHTAQCLNYLKATGAEICLLINFGSPRIDIKRFVR